MEIKRIKSISAFCKLAQIDKPEHPLIAVIDYSKVNYPFDLGGMIFDYYSIAMKRIEGTKMHYGQQIYDFDDGVMAFVSPGQVLRFQRENIPAVQLSIACTS